MRTRALLVSISLAGACGPADDAAPLAPDPIGEELLSFSTALGLPGCGQAHLYRSRRALQLQCFAVDGSFSWENHGTLSAEGEAMLEVELAAADFDDTAPGDDRTFCKSAEAESASMTLWVGDESFTYRPACPTAGVQALHGVATMILGDIADCTELDLLESVEPGCRPY